MPSIINATTTNGVAISPDNSGSLQLATNNGTTAVTIDTSQNVGIGTSSPTQRLSVSGSITSTGRFIPLNGSTILGYVGDDNTISGGTGSNIGIRSDTSMLFATGGSTERMRITSGGNLLVGTTTSYGKITSNSSFSPSSGDWDTTAAISTSGSFGGGIAFIDGSAGYGIYCSDNGNDFYIQGSSSLTTALTGGVYLDNRATSWSSASDEKVKDIIEPITNGLQKLLTLRTVIGKYKDEPEGKRHPFLIAQDVQAVLPEAVSTMHKGQENECLGLSYTDTIPLLVAAIKEQQAMIEELKQEVGALKAK